MFSYHLKFEGIEGLAGEAQDDSIDVLSFSWGLTNEGGRGNGGGGGSGRVNVQDFNFTKHTDKSSPNLMLACATGQHIKKATLYVREAAGEPTGAAANLSAPGMDIELADVMVSSFVIKGEQKADFDWPTESLSLNFSKIVFSEQSQKADRPVVRGWDVKTNKSV